jgi:hypothetical protein
MTALEQDLSIIKQHILYYSDYTDRRFSSTSFVCAKYSFLLSKQIANSIKNTSVNSQEEILQFLFLMALKCILEPYLMIKNLFSLLEVYK